MADLRSHPEWMRDAGAVVFVDEQTSGLGTELIVPTQVGPFRTTDVMKVVGWEEGSLIEVEHRGAVAGVGRFELERAGTGSRLEWRETLRFPWWLGGRFGAWIARPVLRRIWRGNLARLRSRVELSRP